MLLLALTGLSPEAEAASCLGSAPQNVIVLLTDDMRFDGLAVMPLTTSRLAGTEFTRAYVTTPMCCPDRASLLSGGYYAHNVGVLTNSPPNGGFARFDDTRSLPLRLQTEAGYATGLVGKYLNGYEDADPYLPPGWTRFAGWADAQPWTGFTLAEGQTGATAGTGERVRYPGYATDEQAAWSVAFLEAHAAQPMFLVVSFMAPHYPHTPAVEDVDAFPGYTYRDRAYAEADMKDKPAWIRALPQWDADEVAEADANNRERVQTLQSVDRAVITILDAVDALGLADRTIVVFTSDNGEVWGEHRLSQKGVPYEESVRVPLIVSHPALTAGTSEELIATNLDLGATIQDAAGIPIRSDGASLVPLLCDPASAWRESLLLQYWPEAFPSWSSMVTARYKYTEWVTGETELYDLAADPWELESLEGDRDGLADTLASLRGLTIATDTLPSGQVGEPYDVAIPVWGGTPPLRWSAGELPAGLILGEEGRIRGIPAAPGSFEIALRVTDGARSPYNDAALTLEHPVALEVLPAPSVTEPPAPRCGCGDGSAGLLGLLGLRRRRSVIPSAP